MQERDPAQHEYAFAATNSELLAVKIKGKKHSVRKCRRKCSAYSKRWHVNLLGRPGVIITETRLNYPPLQLL